MEGLTPAASEGASGGLFSSGQRSFVCVGGRVPFARGSGGLFIQWKGSVRFGQRSFVYTVEGFRSLGAFSSMWPQRRRTCQGRSPPRPRHPRLPANKIAAARFPRLHFLASGRSGYGILPFPTSGPRPCGPDLARQFRLGDFDAGPTSPTS